MKASWKGVRKRKPEPNKSVAYRMPIEQKKRLDKFCADNDTTQAAVIREALDDFMAANSRRRKTAPAGGLFD